MIQLVPMGDADFVWFRENLIVGYAQNQVEAGEWNQASALQQSREDIAHLLPDGLSTPDHLLLLVVANTPDPVGDLWVKLNRGTDPSAFILDIEIYTPYQRKGYAQQTLQALEALVKPMGISKIGLNVHVQNHGAKALYEKLGYGVTGYSMIKKLDVNA